ncbi:hypothetical protein [Candidatus Rickettsia colombianensi]|uniref:hypothetical protein n=1 Tax=Candidatus Rickettsia colombianensi TaxID=1090944 RepID=UPI0011BABC52|nr:hypothetical protein [Candidatus Rickettsia colombianensi]
MSILYTLLFVANQFVYVKIYRFCSIKKDIVIASRHCCVDRKTHVIPWLDHGMTPSVLYGPCVFLKFYIRFTEFL